MGRAFWEDARKEDDELLKGEEPTASSAWGGLGCAWLRQGERNLARDLEVAEFHFCALSRQQGRVCDDE